MKSTWIPVVVICLLAAGCGDDGGTGGDGKGGDTGDGGGGTQKSGITACGGVQCQAGQYCVDDLTCQPGCTSDENCAGTEQCKRASGEAVGACEGGSAAKNCDAFIALCTMCGTAQADCSAACASQSAQCVSCVVGVNTCNATASCIDQCSTE
jgi:hypothetical protein